MRRSAGENADEAWYADLKRVAFPASILTGIRCTIDAHLRRDLPLEVYCHGNWHRYRPKPTKYLPIAWLAGWLASILVHLVTSRRGRTRRATAYFRRRGAFVCLALLVTVLAACTPLLPPLRSPPPNFKVAFIGDQDVNSNAEAVLQLIKSEGADMVLHQGDIAYGSPPAVWDAQINNVLGEDFPYFASIGNHARSDWPELQALLAARLARIPGASCEGDLGVKSACSYHDLFFILVAPGIHESGHDLGDDYAGFIEQQLAEDRSLWSVCSWHRVMHLMQAGGAPNETGWEVYDACRRGGGIISYWPRTLLLPNASVR